MFTITHKDTRTKARIGKLKTLHGILETPLFLPIATKGTVKHLTPHELSVSGTHALIANAFLLYLRPGLPILKKVGGLHKFMQWDGSIFTDSGGFQILSEKFLRSISDKGVSFNNPYTKKNAFFTPEKVIQIENAIGGDIIMTLDHVPHHDHSHAAVAEAVRRTHHWAERCKKAHTNKKQLLFGITQGAVYKDLREDSAKTIARMHFDGIALGGFGIGEGTQTMLNLVQHSLQFIPEEKPRYLMGVGKPEEILASISLGVDIFDSRYPTQTARHAGIFTHNGMLNLHNARYKHDTKPLDPNCACNVCTTFSRAFLHHLFRIQEPMAERYATLHNIHFIHTLIEESKKAIRAHRFETFKKEFLTKYSL